MEGRFCKECTGQLDRIEGEHHECRSKHICDRCIAIKWKNKGNMEGENVNEGFCPQCQKPIPDKEVEIIMQTLG